MNSFTSYRLVLCTAEELQSHMGGREGVEKIIRGGTSFAVLFTSNLKVFIRGHFVNPRVFLRRKQSKCFLLMVNGSNTEKITCALRSNKTQFGGGYPDASGFQLVPIFSDFGVNVLCKINQIIIIFLHFFFLLFTFV